MKLERAQCFETQGWTSCTGKADHMKNSTNHVTDHDAKILWIPFCELLYFWSRTVRHSEHKETLFFVYIWKFERNFQTCQ